MDIYINSLELISLAQQGDEFAKEKLLLDNYPLIKSVIRRFKNRGVEYDDLYQLGCVGFVKAINNFDASFNVKFSTYAVPMIAGEVKRFLRDDGVIKVSRSIKLKAKLINQYIQECHNNSHETPTLDDISKKFDLEPAEIAFVMESSKMPISLSTKLDDSDDGSALLEDVVPGDKDEDTLMNKLLVKQLLEGLNERDKKIITLRYYMDKTQSEIAKMLGVSQVQISRIENKIINNIREIVN